MVNPDSDRKRHIEKLIGAAVRRHRRVQTTLESRPTEPAPGDLYVFSLPIKIALQWAVILVHPDDRRLLYTIPADDHRDVGIADTRIPEDVDCGPLVLRCGCGLWLRRSDFDPQLRSGHIAERYVAAATRTLAQMVRDSLRPTSRQHETDVDPEYLRWMTEVAQAVEVLRSSLVATSDDADTEKNNGGGVIFLADFESQWPQPPSGTINRHALSIPPDDVPSPLPGDKLMAAASNDLIDEVLEQRRAASTLPVRYHKLDSGFPGLLVACLEQERIHLVYTPDTDESAPRVSVLTEQGSWTVLQWKPTPAKRMFRAFPKLSWHNDKIQLKTTGNRQITIQRES